MVADRKALLDEFNSIVAPQKAALSQRLPQLFQQYYAPPQALPALPAANGNAAQGQQAKRGPGPDQALPDSKRLKQQPSALPDADKRIEALFKEVSNLISKKLMQKREAQPFKEPVDIVKLGIPDYFKFVQHPMDLGTIKSNLAAKKYKTPMEVCEDVRLVFRNCATYNQLGTPVRSYGDQLSDIWEKAWHESRIEEKWAEVMLQKDPTGSVVPFKVAQLNNQLKSAIQLIPPGQPASSDGMSDLEKRKLSIALADLQGEHLHALLEELKGLLPDTNGEEEVELDLDQLPTHTLRKMQEFVNRLAAGRPSYNPPSKQPANNRPDNQAPAQALPAPLQPQPGDDDDAVIGVSSGQTSPAVTVDSQDQEVKDSNMDDANGNRAPFVMASRAGAGAGVDESATAPNASSSILRDRAAVRKPDVQVDAAAWDVNTLEAANEGEEDAAQDAEDEVWQNFGSQAQKAKQQAEEQRKLKEQQEEELRKVKEAEEEEARRAASEAEERERQLRAEEQRLQEEQQRQRMEQCDKEVDEIKAKQGTANLVHHDEDMQDLGQVQPSEGDLAEIGLTYKNDDEDVDFDD